RIGPFVVDEQIIRVNAVEQLAHRSRYRRITKFVNGKPYMIGPGFPKHCSIVQYPPWLDVQGEVAESVRQACHFLTWIQGQPPTCAGLLQQLPAFELGQAQQPAPDAGRWPLMQQHTACAFQDEHCAASLVGFFSNFWGGQVELAPMNACPAS